MKVGYIALLAALAAAPVMAAEPGHGQSAAAQAVVEGRGKVKAVDAAGGMVTLSHEAIPAIGWPPMTMDFALQPASLATKLAPGQSVKFRLKAVGDGDYVISAIEPAK